MTNAPVGGESLSVRGLQAPSPHTATWASLLGAPHITVSPGSTVQSGANFGSNSGDEANGILAALQSVPTPSVLRMELMAGDFYLDEIVGASSVRTLEIFGQGQGATVLHVGGSFSGSGNAMFSLTVDQQSAGLYGDVYIHDLSVSGTPPSGIKKWFHVYHGGSSAGFTRTTVERVTADAGTAGLLQTVGGNNTGFAEVAGCRFLQDIAADLVDFGACIHGWAHHNVVLAQANPPFVLYPGGSSAPLPSLDVHDNRYYGNATYHNAFVSLWAGITGLTSFDTVHVHDNLVDAASAVYEIDSPNATNTMAIGAMDVHDNTRTNGTALWRNTKGISYSIGSTVSERVGSVVQQAQTGLATTLGGSLALVLLKAGVPADSDFTSPQDGLVVIDTADNRLYVRQGGAWHYASLT